MVNIKYNIYTQKEIKDRTFKTGTLFYRVSDIKKVWKEYDDSWHNGNPLSPNELLKLLGFIFKDVGLDKTGTKSIRK